MEFDILYAINSIHNGFLDTVIPLITKLGDKGIFWIAVGIVLLLFKKTRKCGLLMLISMGIGVLIGNVILKNLIARDRPCWINPNIPLLVPNPKDFSFPSGHTLASFEAAITIFLHNKKWGALALFTAVLIGFSRLYLFVHFPTDVLGGALLGTIIALSVYGISKKIKFNKKVETEN